MTDRERKLVALAEVAALATARALAPVAAAQKRLDAQHNLIASLADQRAALLPDGADPVIAARLARQAADLRRQQADAMADLARLHAALDLAKSAARHSLAREHALSRLMDAGKRAP